MRSNLFSFVLAALSVSDIAFAWSSMSRDSGINFEDHLYQAPGPDDLRSPCPGLNTLANHGFLPRNGRNITIPTVLQAAIDGYNIQPDVIILAAKVTLLVSDAYDNFSLDDLDMHENVEHDASVSRSDYYFGDNHSFNATIYNQTMAQSNPGVDYYNATSAGLVQKARLEDSKAINPSVIATSKELIIRTRESALYLGVMGNASTGVAPKKFVDIFFREERLPIAEGWKRSDFPITSDVLNSFSGTIVENSDWQGPTQNDSELVITPSGSIQTLLKPGQGDGQNLTGIFS